MHLSLGIRLVLACLQCLASAYLFILSAREGRYAKLAPSLDHQRGPLQSTAAQSISDGLYDMVISNVKRFIDEVEKEKQRNMAEAVSNSKGTTILLSICMLHG
jgi:hypothetical protein